MEAAVRRGKKKEKEEEKGGDEKSSLGKEIRVVTREINQSLRWWCLRYPRKKFASGWQRRGHPQQGRATHL